MPTRFSRFKFSRRSLHFALRRGKLRVGAAIFHWASPQFNPFLSLELHRSWRSKSGPLFIFWPLLIIGVALALTAQYSTPVTAFIIDLARHQAFITRAFSKNEIAWLALVSVGLCGCATLIYSQRAARIFLRDYNAGTFNQLLLLPLAETRLGLLTSAPGAFAAMALWFLLMPLWLVALATNQWSWREFLGVPLLFLLFTIRPPEWTPLYEIFPAPPVMPKEPDDAETTKEATAEEASISAAPVNQTQKNEDEPEEDDEYFVPVADPRYQTILKFDPTGTITLLIVWQVAMFWARFAGFKVPPSAVNYLLPQWREFLPPEVWNLLPSFPFSWPLLIVQFLTSPLPFFGIALPPGLWLVPRLLLMRYAAFSTFRLSYLGSHSLQFRRWGRYWCEVKRAQTFLFWFFASGFLWPWLISKGAFAAALPGAPINASWARAALWTVLLIISTWMISARLHSVFDTPFKKTSVLRRQKVTLVRCRKAWHKVKGLFWGPAALYFVLCWLGGTFGMDAVWRSRLLTTILVMLAYLLADFSSLVLKNVLPASLQNFWNGLRFFWFWGLLWEAVFRVAGAHYATIPFDLKDEPHVLLSPFVSLLNLLNSDATLSLQGALWQLIFASLIGVAAYQLTFQAQDTFVRRNISIAAEEIPKKPSVFLKFVTTFWRVIWFVPGLFFQIIFRPLKTGAIGFYHFAERLRNAAQPFLDRQVQQLWLWIDTFDNPILRRALRTKREENLSTAWLSFVFIQCLILLVLLCVSVFKSVSLLFFGSLGKSGPAALGVFHWRGWGDVAFGVTMAFGFIANLVALFSHTKIFDKERANGGMVFLFLTPLTESEIIGGYLGAALLPCLWHHSALYPFILVACLLEIAAGQVAILPLLLLITLLLHAFLVLNAMSSVWSATRARRVGDGGAWLFFFAMIPQGLFLLIFGGIITSTQGFWAVATTVFGIILCLFAAYIFWIDALRCLRRERFGDLAIRGTIAN